MGRKNDYSRGTRRYKIVKSLFSLGACPYTAFQYIDENFEMVRRIIRKMVTDGQVLQRKTNTGRFFILSEYNSLPEDMKAAFSPELMDYYQTIAIKNREDLYHKKEKIQRIKDLADASMLFQSMTEHSYIFDKPFLLDPDSTLENTYCYYTSKEIKDADGGFYHDIVGPDVTGKAHKNVTGSRIIGVYITGHATWFNIYELENKTIVWSSNAERNMQRHVKSVMASKKLNGSEEGAVFFYGNDSAPAAVFTEDPFREVRRKHLSVDRTYDHMYFLPRDRNGFLIMQMMSLPDWRYRIMKQHIPAEYLLSEVSQFDGMDRENGIIYCDFCVPDLVSLKSAYLAVSTGSWKGKLEIFCYDIQESFVKEAFSEIDANITTVSIRETEEKYYSEVDSRDEERRNKEC